MTFSPTNPIVQLCIRGMAKEENGKLEEAMQSFQQAWREATNDFEKFLAAYYLAGQQHTASEKLKWFNEALLHATRSNDVGAKSAFATLHAHIAACYEELRQPDEAKRHRNLADEFRHQVADNGPFYHGTRADLQMGDLLTPGNRSNYAPGLIMNHIYFTALPDGAGLAAALAQGEGRERVYIVEPMGKFENDPNVTDKKFPGNPTRSYRTGAPLKIIGEVNNWQKQTPEQLQHWRDKLANNNGEIIN